MILSHIEFIIKCVVCTRPNKIPNQMEIFDHSRRMCMINEFTHDKINLIAK